MKLYIGTDEGTKLYYVKLKHSDPNNKVYQVESEYTLKASQAGIAPFSFLLNGALFLENINGVDLINLKNSEEYLEFFPRMLFARNS